MDFRENVVLGVRENDVLGVTQDVGRGVRQDVGLGVSLGVRQDVGPNRRLWVALWANRRLGVDEGRGPRSPRSDGAQLHASSTGLAEASPSENDRSPQLHSPYIFS